MKIRFREFAPVLVLLPFSLKSLLNVPSRPPFSFPLILLVPSQSRRRNGVYFSLLSSSLNSSPSSFFLAEPSLPSFLPFVPVPTLPL
jgi:hypothetical protein